MKNFLLRSISGIGFGVVILTALLWCKEGFLMTFSTMIAILMFEFFRITLDGKAKIERIYSVILGLGLFLIPFYIVYYGLDNKYLLWLLVPVSLIFIRNVYNPKEDFNTCAILLSAPIYIALPFALSNLVVFSEGGFDGRIFLAFIFILWSCDVGAYTVGMIFGQKKNSKKLFPSISPKKSWAGYIGGLVTATCTGYIIYHYKLVDFELVHTIILSIIINVFSTLGDLFESKLKRNYSIKDSGNILPGHGGLLDRFDGALLALPATVLYILIFI